MSHIATIQLEIKDLQSLEKAASYLGLEMVPQSTYRWYGYSVGDYALPEGIAKEDLGKCDYALRIPGNSKAYEVGVVKMPNGKFQLLWDFWNGGFGLQQMIGEGGRKLKVEYAAQLAIKHQKRRGFSCTRSIDRNGNTIIKGISQGARA